LFKVNPLVQYDSSRSNVGSHQYTTYNAEFPLCTDALRFAASHLSDWQCCHDNLLLLSRLSGGAVPELLLAVDLKGFSACVNPSLFKPFE
jgi:hypothetical protein